MRNLVELAPPHLSSLLDRQQHVLTRGQLNEFGIDDKAIARRVRYSNWQRVLPGIYVIHGGRLTDEQRRTAAALYAGDSAQLTGGAALLWYGFRYVPRTTDVHLLLPHERRRRSTGFVIIQRTLELDRYAREMELYSVCSPARATVDFCRSFQELRTVRAVMAEAVQRHFTSLNKLDEEVRRAVRSRTAIVRRVLAELVDGARSAPEAELRSLTATSKVLPPILWNPPLVAPDGSVLPTPDGYIRETGVALEVDSREHHSDPDGWSRTLQRHNVLSQFGAMVLHFTPNEIRREPANVLALIERTHLSRVSRPVPVAVVARDPCTS